MCINGAICAPLRTWKRFSFLYLCTGQTVPGEGKSDGKREKNCTNWPIINQHYTEEQGLRFLFVNLKCIGFINQAV